MIISKLPRPAFLIVGLFLIASVITPLPYVIIEPGGGRNVLGSTIQISQHKTYPVTGKLLLTTIYATSPSSSVFAGIVLKGWINGDSIVLPRELIYPPQSTAKEIDAKNVQEMVDSQADAKAAALTYLGYSIASKISKDKSGRKVTGFDFPFPIKINLKNTGGPSGGLVFAVGIIEKLTSEDLLAGRIVAGTGTMDKSGHVGGIGGIDEKLIAARRAGATIFLAPVANCADITRVPAGITVYSVSTLSEAVLVLKNSKRAIPHCTWQRIR